MIKNINDFVSKSSIKPCLQGILVTPNKIVATDSFKLIEIQQENSVKDACVMMLPKGIKTIDTVTQDEGGISFTSKKGGEVMKGTRIDEQYPDYEVIIKQLPAPVFKIRLSAEHLEAIAKAFNTSQKSMMANHIDIEFYGEEKVVKFTRDNITALLMPQIK